MTSDFTIAVHALVYLNHMATTLSSEQIAQNVCTNPVCVRRVLAKLKKAQLLMTKEGADGGYLFHLDPGEVNLKMVCDALQAKLVCAPWKPGSPDLPCLISSGMAGVLDDLYRQLNMLCCDRLETITIQDIDKTIFHS